MFVMISGALLLDERAPFTPAQFYIRRAARVIVPLVFWTAVYLIYRRIHNHTGRATLLLDTLQGEPFYHLWFLYLIVGLYAATPLLRIIAANSDRTTLTIAAAAILFIASVDSAASATLGAFDGKKNVHTFLVTWLPFTGYFFTGYILTNGRCASRRFRP
jgi:surface polysaccharide O-acyltransferase-like enzyme